MKTMIRNSTLSLTLIIILSVFSVSANSQVTYVDNGSSTTYTLNAGDSLYINSGTYTGTINTWVAGSKITIAASAYFKPSSFSDNKSKLIVYGTSVLPVLTTGAGFDLKNYGNITVTGSAAMNGGAQTWTNFFGATITFNGQMAINYDGSSFINNGTVNAKSDFFLYSVSSISNNSFITVNGDFKTSKGQVNNGGKLYTTKGLTISGPTTFTNSCRTVAEKGITIDNAASIVYNNGFLWASNSSNTSTITNSGTIINGVTAKIKSVTFTNYGNITGGGSMYFTGVTTASGTIGTAGTTTDTIKVYDVTRSNPSTIFDNQWGTVRPNVKYAAVPAPDTTNAPYSTCSSVYISASGITVLPIKWNYFYATLVNEIPVLDWSTEFDAGTRFEVQRSYDNNNFSSIASVTGENNKTIYQYTDKKADKNKTMVYYRIKGIEPSGENKFTEVRVVKFSNNQHVSAQVMPNPFTSQFSINYEGKVNEQLVIKIYNGMGQLSVVKKTTTTAGLNHIAVNEAAQFAKGIYIIEISNDHQVVGTQKIVKQ